jgi:alcohol dehydrogenase class IV
MSDQHSAAKEKMQMMVERLKIKGAYNLPYQFTLLNQQLGLPQKLRELGITKDELEPLAQRAKADHCTPTNQRPLTVEDCIQIYSEAW